MVKTDCDKDNNGNYCPLNSHVLKISDDMTEEQAEKVVNKVEDETCKSQKCTDSYLYLIEELNRITNDYLETLMKEKNLSKSDLYVIRRNFNGNNDETTEHLRSKCISIVENGIKNINVYLLLSLVSIIYLFF
eukprot:jgi/Orpsp1_1/1174079/evm.model.c7180000048839.2